jgi:hypothetical protein
MDYRGQEIRARGYFYRSGRDGGVTVFLQLRFGCRGSTAAGEKKSDKKKNAENLSHDRTLRDRVIYKFPNNEGHYKIELSLLLAQLASKAP